MLRKVMKKCVKAKEVPACVAIAKLLMASGRHVHNLYIWLVETPKTDFGATIPRSR